MNLQRRLRLNDRLLIGGFLLLIVLPILGLPLVSNDNSEKRVLAPFPKIHMDRSTLATFPGAFQNFVSDRFAFRDKLLDLHSELSARLLNESTSPRALIGRDGWLFYLSDGSLEDIRRSDYLDAATKERWRASISGKAEWLNRHGIEYRFVIAPDKHAIYPEMLPANVPVRPGKSRLQDLLASIGESSAIVDLSPALLSQKVRSANRLYFRTDTHWTSYGAYVGYRALMSSLSGRGARDAIALPDISFVPSAKSEVKDIATFARLNIAEPDLITDLSAQTTCEHAGQLPDGLAVATSMSPRVTLCDKGRGTALVFHDSFMRAVMPYLSSHFAQVVYVWNNPDDAFFARIVKEVRPDVVIEERVERYMRTPPGADPHQSMQTDRAQARQ